MWNSREKKRVESCGRYSRSWSASPAPPRQKKKRILGARVTSSFTCVSFFFASPQSSVITHAVALFFVYTFYIRSPPALIRRRRHCRTLWIVPHSFYTFFYWYVTGSAVPPDRVKHNNERTIGWRIDLDPNILGGLDIRIIPAGEDFWQLMIGFCFYTFIFPKESSTQSECAHQGTHLVSKNKLGNEPIAFPALSKNQTFGIVCVCVWCGCKTRNFLRLTDQSCGRKGHLTACKMTTFRLPCLSSPCHPLMGGIEPQWQLEVHSEIEKTIFVYKKFSRCQRWTTAYTIKYWGGWLGRGVSSCSKGSP